MNVKFAALAAVSILAGCSSQSVKEIGRAPSMSPIGTGLQFTGNALTGGNVMRFVPAAGTNA